MPRLKNTPEQELAVRMKAAMVGKGWTQRHLAGICKMTEGQISRIINEPSRHNYSTICEVASKLGITSLPVI